MLDMTRDVTFLGLTSDRQAWINDFLFFKIEGHPL